MPKLKSKTKPESDLKLNALELMKNKKITNYELFNKLNNIRVKNGGKLMNYTNFLNVIKQNNKSVLYQDLAELCEALDCEIQDLLILVKE